jgi:hypothetical protein
MPPAFAWPAAHASPVVNKVIPDAISKTDKTATHRYAQLNRMVLTSAPTITSPADRLLRNPQDLPFR